MDSVLDDLENVEDITELESRLYAQIHHEAPAQDNAKSSETELLSATPIHRVVTNRSVINNSTDFKLSNRYWNNSQNAQQIVQRKKFDNNTKNEIENEQTNIKEISKLQEKTFKPFTIYESIIPGLVVSNDEQQISSSKSMPLQQKNQEECATFKSDNEKSIMQVKSSAPEAHITTISKNKRLKLKKRRQRERKNLKNQSKNIPEKQNRQLQPPVQEDEPEEHIQKKNKYNKKTGVGLETDESLVRNYLKMQKLLKVQAKKIKAKAVRQKNVQKPQENQILSFDLISDDNGDDDVIEIPVPPPPIVTINDSSEDDDMANAKATEENKSKKGNFPADTETSFAKPKQVKISNKNASNIADNNSSRCASPCSVISADDFIEQADRSRLLNERIIVNDDYLICTGDNVETYIESQQDSHSNIDDNQNNDLTTVRNRNNRKTIQKSKDYCGTQDVYCESESDIPESIHSKSSVGVKTAQSHTTSKGNAIIEELSSQTNSDCNEQDNITQKIKRLRKRRASSSNKETETNNDSSDSDGEETILTNEVNSSTTTLPFITRGEAVESCKIKALRKRPSQSSSRLDINSSDNEFINMLHTISQPKTNNNKRISLEHYSDESTKSEENLTARIIAEEILSKRRKKSKQSNAIEEDSTVNNSISHDRAKQDQSNKESNWVIPALDIDLIEKQFDIIDKIPESNFIDDAQMETNEINSNINIENSNPTSMYNVIHTNSNNIGWTEEMFRFYNCSWGGENLSVNLIRKKMDRTARWTIHTEDRFPKYKRFMNVRCNNCSEMGHMQTKCPVPKKPLMCSMCGQTGHREPRCPNTICLRCGKKSRVFIKSCNSCSTQNRLICPICKIHGHGIDFCPDKWRRYHSTIINNAQLNSTVIYNQNKFCCICAGRGHLSENCKAAYRFSEYPLSTSEIKSHRKSYDDQKKTSTLLKNINSYNLLYEPDDSINFSFSTNSKITTKQYYGRFLNAVGLDYIINEPNKRKLPISLEKEIEKSQEKRRKTTNKNNQKSQETNKNVKPKNRNLVRNPMYKKNSSNEANKKVNESVMEISESQSTLDSGTLNHTNKSTEREELNKNLEHREHTFKSPIVLLEKLRESPEKADLNKRDDNSQNHTNKETLNLDSDSNYSFSEHFDVNITTSSTPAKMSRPMEELPDYIPLNDNANDENSNQYSDDDTADFENTFKLNDIPCVAKIYLKKDFSDYLLSPEGNKFLVHNSNKFDVKASIDWTSVGNILVLEGLRDNQDKFHTELLLAFRSLPDKLNRKDLEKSQQVPRKRIKMIRFLSDNLRILQKSTFLSADVNLLFKQLQDYENKNSQTSWKMAEKTRRTLNMILFGKIGLRDGKQNLDLLVNSLKSLALTSELEYITNKMREDINKSWKYIFSSQKHENYEELVEMFYKMKRNNIFPELKIDERLLGRNILALSLTEKNAITTDCNYYNMNNKYNIKQSTPNETSVLSKCIPKLTLDTSEPMILQNQSNISLNISSIQNNSITQSFSEFLSENTEKCEWENQFLKLLTQIESCTKNSSIYWSKQSVKYINNFISFYKSNQLLFLKLQNVLQKANNGLLSYDDYRDILKIYNNSKISEKI